uniref:Lant_dehydr_N domain-containing protein n=1 Tax=Rhabditophanes sp. KR3021 TaxID=114890 RepID=A0AC35TYU3_9BILA
MKYKVLKDDYEELSNNYKKLIDGNGIISKRRIAVHESGKRSRLDFIKDIYSNFVLANANSPPDKLFIERLAEYFEFQSCANLVFSKKYTTEEAIKLFLELNMTQTRFKILLRSLADQNIFPSFYSIENSLKEQATGKYQYSEYHSNDEVNGNTIAGCFAVDIEEILKDRIICLYDAHNLIYKEKIDESGSSIFYVNCCLGGDSGQGSCKFNIQPELRNANHSSMALSIVAFWFGKDTRNLMEHFLKIPIERIDEINKNGFNMTINDKKRLSDYNSRVAEYRSLEHSQDNLDYSEKSDPLSKTIESKNIITPWLHIFLGLFKDEFLELMKIVKDEENAEDIEERIFQFIKSLNINTKNYFETFSELKIEALESIYKEIPRHKLTPKLHVLLDHTIDELKHNGVLNLFSEQGELKIEALESIYKEIPRHKLTPKLHVLLDHTIDELKHNGVLNLFSEQGVNAVIIYEPEPGTYSNGTTKPSLYFKYQKPSKWDCEVTDTRTLIIHPETYDCKEVMSWHFEHIKTAYQNSTTNKCEEMNVISLISDKYILPINFPLMNPIKIRPMKQQGTCGKGFMDGLNFFSYKLNNNKDIWSKTNFKSPTLRVTNKYPAIVPADQHILYDQMFMYGLQLGALNLTKDYLLMIKDILVEEGNVKNEDDFLKKIQNYFDLLGNKLFKESCEHHNELIASKKDIQEVTNLLLDKEDIKAERIENGIKVKQCKWTEIANLETVPLVLRPSSNIQIKFKIGPGYVDRIASTSDKSDVSIILRCCPIIDGEMQPLQRDDYPLDLEIAQMHCHENSLIHGVAK